MKFSLADLEVHSGVPSFLQFQEDEQLTLALNRTLMDHNFFYKSNNSVSHSTIFISLLLLTKYIKNNFKKKYS